SELGGLESLELQENQLTSLPSSLGSLPRLRILNVSKNALSTLPVEALTRCPIQELDISSNKVVDTLFPSSTTSWQTLQSLNATGNRLTSFSETEITLPS